MDLVTFVYGVPEVFALLRIHENPNVTADAVLFVNHAKAHAGKPGIQIRQHVPYCYTFGHNARLTLRI